MTSSRGTPSICRVVDLPFDVLLEVAGYLPGADVCTFFSTCKVLRRYLRHESIWHRLCARYGLCDLTHFSISSYYTIYTGLLHTYGPLLGLWANDHPFRGNIVEFSLFPGDEIESGGIVGEVWRLSDSVSEDESPQSPRLIRFLKITFDLPPSLAEQVNPEGLQRAYPMCWPQPNPLGQPRDHLVSIEVLPPSNHGQFMQAHRRTFVHPEFPAPGTPWLDLDRALPRLKMSQPGVVNQRALASILPAARLPVMFTSSTSHIKPSSIRFRCPMDPIAQTSHANYHKPALPIHLMDTSPPRYYPLRREVAQRIDPESEDWHLGTMAGVWLGYFGQHGTECLYFGWEEDSRKLHAWKITGDLNVPRGVVSWEVVGTTSGELGMHSSFLEDTTTTRARRFFVGHGTLGDRGFT
ncbi:hypothetical protein OBBRIDRAFT_724140 [Obba rivulosa]|uniref:F-box domain-containing protein n=1 Tax=Obba rivulosa TaxID=1052685 RepID=A0A8E2DQ78_9APHY|nr:hypothetical protein OBBRIDRAFT_724140 [Obba rivulosa]